MQVEENILTNAQSQQTFNKGNKYTLNLQFEPVTGFLKVHHNKILNDSALIHWYNYRAKTVFCYVTINKES